MRFISAIKEYPLRERLPYAILMLCVMIWFFRKDWPGNLAIDALAGILVITFFCSPKGRPFWFLWGILVGSLAISGVHAWKLW